MPSLENAATRGAHLYVTEAGVHFNATIFAAGEGEAPSYDFTSPRLLMRVQNHASVKTRDIMVDAFGRRFLVADHDVTSAYRIHRLFQITGLVSWTRTTMLQNELTGLNRSNGPETELGPIWAALEMNNREFTDSTLRVKEEVKRLLTGAEVQLNDRVDGMIVKRVDNVLGVIIAELQ